MSPATGERDHDVHIDVRTLTVHALLQEARRRRATTLPAQIVRAALLADLEAIGSPAAER